MKDLAYKLTQILFTFILSWIFTFSGLAQTPESWVEKGNKAYTKGKFNQAVEYYQNSLKSGKESSYLYYNLGNTYFRLGNIPSAILNYERAKRLNPYNEDINLNLEIANRKIIDKIEVVPQLFFVHWWNTLSVLLPVDFWAVLSIIFSLFFFMFLFFYLIAQGYFGRRRAFRLFTLSLILGLICYHFADKQHDRFTNSKEAIIFSPTVNVKSSPDEKGTDKFVIHEGTKVILLDDFNNWFKIKIANGSVGWVEKNVMDII
jgi:tetratricopeptide (TPR) repeat protein